MMDLKVLMDAMSQSAEQERSNYHLTLGKLITALEGVNGDLRVVFDLMDPCSPSEPISYRGYYSDLSFPPSDDPVMASDVLKWARDANGNTFEGYKGGDFTMGAKTPLWASPYGSANGIAIVDVKVIGDRVVLITKQILD